MGVFFKVFLLDANHKYVLNGRGAEQSRTEQAVRE